MEPHPLQAQTMWRHLVTAAGSINKSVVYKTHISTSNVCFVCLFRFYSGLLPSILYRFFYSVNTLQHFTLEFTSISFVSSLHAVWAAMRRTKPTRLNGLTMSSPLHTRGMKMEEMVILLRTTRSPVKGSVYVLCMTMKDKNKMSSPLKQVII